MFTSMPAATFYWIVTTVLFSVAEAAVTQKPEKRSGFDSGSVGEGGGRGCACTFRCPDGGGPTGEWLEIGGRPVGGLLG